MAAATSACRTPPPIRRLPMGLAAGGGGESPRPWRPSSRTANCASSWRLHARPMAWRRSSSGRRS
eukprot:SM011140S18840  [mRNA]  locus=s11140:47:397:+ [translate_table: standard]